MRAVFLLLSSLLRHGSAPFLGRCDDRGDRCRVCFPSAGSIGPLRRHDGMDHHEGYPPLRWVYLQTKGPHGSPHRVHRLRFSMLLQLE